MGVIKSLMDQARRICEPEHKAGELKHLEKALRIKRVLTKGNQTGIERKYIEKNTSTEHISTIYLPYLYST